MLGFWILTALLLLAGYAFFLPALLGRAERAGKAVDRRRLNLLLHRQRREELMREAGEADRDTLAEELDRDLLADLTASEPHPAPFHGGGRGLLWAALLAAPLLAAFIYGHLGRPDLIGFRAGPQMAGAGDTPSAEDFQVMIDNLAQRLKQKPDDLDGWLLLARSLMATDQIDKALTAFEFALKLAPDDLDVQASYAQALAEGNDGKFEGKPSEIVAAILAKSPKHPRGLWLAGLIALERGDHTKAVAHWEALKAQFAPNSEDAQQLAEYIAKIQGAAPTAAARPTPETSNVPSGARKSIRVQVALADELQPKTAPDDTLFVFARAAQGPAIPLAIVRKRVKDLPLEVVLDDSMSMLPGMNLSAFEQLIIGARISKSGQAMPAPGDLQGLSGPSAARDGQSFTVRITEEVR